MANLLKIAFGIVLISYNVFSMNNKDDKTNTVNAKKLQNSNEVNTTEDVNDDKKENKSIAEEKKNNSDKHTFRDIKELCVGAEEYCNMTEEEYTKMLRNYIYPQTYEWVLIGTHTMVFIMGLVGNALVCVAVYRNHYMRTVTNYFIVNLAAADFMVILVCLPPTVLWDVTETWFFGDAMCKIVLYLQSVSVTVSVLTLTFISMDRWYAICFPLKFKSTTRRAKLFILIIWISSLTFNSPELVVLTTQTTVPLRFNLEYLVQCVATWSDRTDLIWHVVKLTLIYTIPLMLMTVAYYQIVKVLWHSDKIPGQTEMAKLAPAEQSLHAVVVTGRLTDDSVQTCRNVGKIKVQLRSRRKAAKMLAAVVIMFAVCYFPVHLLSMLRAAILSCRTLLFIWVFRFVLCLIPRRSALLYGPMSLFFVTFRYTSLLENMEQNDVITFLALVSHVLCYANSAINPLIYNFMSGKFRREFRRAFCCDTHPGLEHPSTLTRLTNSYRMRNAMHETRRHGNRYAYNTDFF